MILDFFKTYWREILDIIAFVVALVLFIVKKKPVKVVDTIKETILKGLPIAIKCAEKTHLKGHDKLAYCVELIFDALKGLGYENVEDYRNFIVFSIEDILSTPQKKGENDGTKN